MALFVTSLRCNDLSAFGTKRARHERQRIAGVPFSPSPRFIDSFFCRLVGEVAATKGETPPTDMRAAKAPPF